MAGGGFDGFLTGETRGVRFLGEEGGDGAAVGFEPGFAAEMGLRTSRGGREWTVEAEDRVGFLVGDPLDGTEDVRGKFGAGLFSEFAGLFVKGSGSELEVVEGDEVFESIDGKWNAKADGECADGKYLDLPFHADRTGGNGAFVGGEPGAARLVEEEVARTAAGGVDGVGGDGRAEKLWDGIAAHLIGDVVGEEVDDLAGVAL
jgi:hypothetical protein